MPGVKWKPHKGIIKKQMKSNQSKLIIAFLGLRSGIVGLLGMVILVGMGEKMAERFLPLYMISLGSGIIAVGLLNGLDNFLSAIYSLSGGYLSDRLGTKKALLIFNIMAMIGFLIVVFIPTWQALIAGSFLFISWTAISLPATMSLITEVLPPNKQTMGVSMHALVRRIPMALGPVIGGIFIDLWGIKTGINRAFIAAFILALIALIIQQKLIKEEKQNFNKPIFNKNNPLKLFFSMSPALKKLLISDILIRFCEQIPYAFVIIWSMRTISMPVTGKQFGFLTAIEMITAIFIYIPIAYFADKNRKKPFIIISFINFTIFPLTLLFCRSFSTLIIAFIIRGLKELGEPTRKALIMELISEGKKASMFGLYYLIRDLVVSISAFGGAFLWQINPTVNLLTASMFGLMGTIWFIWNGKRFSINN